MASCQPKKVEITPAFYHWQTNLNLTNSEKNYLSKLSVQKIYPKFFDVDWDFNQQEPIAKAALIVSTTLSPQIEIIPTVFITNRTLVHLPNEKLPDLAQKISQKLLTQIVDFESNKIKEIQFDCDWTQSTKTHYFQLLNLLKKSFESKGFDLSATIRLHQIKYAEKTGIPPVKRGILMYYNMGKVQELETINSILDNDIGRQYLANLGDYPLPLDVALPLFQWGVLFRNDKMIQLINQLNSGELADIQRFTKIDSNHWEVIKSTFLDGVYLYKNDEIRIEKIEFTELEIAARLLNSELKKESRSVVFYHLDSTIIQQFEVARLEHILLEFER